MRCDVLTVTCGGVVMAIPTRYRALIEAHSDFTAKGWESPIDWRMWVQLPGAVVEKAVWG